MGMEPEVQDFLKRVVWSISLVLVYMLILSTFGIAAGWFFFYDTPTLGNYVFYTWTLVSTVAVVIVLIKWWRKKFKV